MRKIILILLSICILSGCAKNTNENSDRLKIVTSFYPVHIFTENITQGAKEIEVKNLSVKNVGCLHNYTLTTNNMRDIERADVFIINGAGMEKSFIDDIRELYPNLKIIDTSEGVELIKNPKTKEINSHIWLNLDNAKIQVNNIKEGLCKIDENNSYKYTENANKYIEEINKLKNDYSLQDTNIVAMHDSISYFAKGAGLNVIDIIQNDEEDMPSQKRIQEIIDNIKQNDVKSILVQDTASREICDTIANESGANVYVFSDITSGRGNKGDYINIMKENLETIKNLR